MFLCLPKEQSRENAAKLPEVAYVEQNRVLMRGSRNEILPEAFMDVGGVFPSYLQETNLF